MIILAAALTLSITLEANLRPLVQRQEVFATTAMCGIKVVGYHFTGRPGQEFRYGRESFKIPREGFVEVISLARVKTYMVDGRKLPLEDGVSPLDGFSLRWINLPFTPSSSSLTGEIAP